MSGSSACSDPQKTEEAVNDNYVKAVVTSKQIVYSANWCFSCCAEQNHNVCSTAVEEQLKQRVVQLFEPSSISLLLICPGLS